MPEAGPENSIRSVVDACSDCDICRHLMEGCCLVFPLLYGLYDKEKETGRPINDDELRLLSEQCTLCGLCPCSNIRAALVRGKTEAVQSEGIPLHIRLLSDPQRCGRLSGRVSKIINKALSTPYLHHPVKKLAKIHTKRDLPHLPKENFFEWAQKNGLDGRSHRALKVAYFAGCTAGYLFPRVAQATVMILRQNGVGVHVPPQQCCGMPTFVEGDREKTLRRVQFNLERLLGVLEAGYDPVCSCPTCGYLMKLLLKEGAFYSEEYQQSVNATPEEIKIPGHETGSSRFIHLKKSMFAEILKDDGYFSAFDPLQRITLSENLLDVGEYLYRLHRCNKLNSEFGRLDGRMVYFAPCHQREQGIGSPYMALLTMIPGLQVQSVGDAMDCCGMGGNFGFKKNFHDASIKLSEPLIQKITTAEPDAVITDCLSCRLQFQHLMPYPVYHPVEILDQAYKAAAAE